VSPPERHFALDISEETMNFTTTMRNWRRVQRATLAAATIGLALAGCSSSSDDGNASSTGSDSAASADTTVTVGDASGHAGVLATADGSTLYVSDQEDGAVLCKSKACTAIWEPLTVGGGKKPTGPDEVSGKLDTIKRPDGSTQVAFDGKPLYTFSFDKNAGEVGGDGEKDSFDGTAFTWQVATVDGGASEPTPSDAPEDGGYDY
jgi:predicted lipoprotein with Yx(FWY)xxD motif